MCCIVIATAAGVTAFLILVSGDFQRFRNIFTGCGSEDKYFLPLITEDGKVVSTLEELDDQLHILKCKLNDKQDELEGSKSKIQVAVDSLHKLSNTSAEMRKYYLKLTMEVEKSESDYKVLREQIDEYQKKKEVAQMKNRGKESSCEDLMKEFDSSLCSRSSRKLLVGKGSFDD